jgi:hypothetical protein
MGGSRLHHFAGNRHLPVSNRPTNETREVPDTVFSLAVDVGELVARRRRFVAYATKLKRERRRAQTTVADEQVTPHGSPDDRRLEQVDVGAKEGMRLRRAGIGFGY